MKETIATLTARLAALEACVGGLVITHPNKAHGWAQIDRLVTVARKELRDAGATTHQLAAFEQTALAAQRKT